MSTFEVMRTVDAYVRYIAKVEASTPEEAAKLAEDNEDAYQWEHDSTSEYDAREFVTLNSEDASEIESSRTGDL